MGGPRGGPAPRGRGGGFPGGGGGRSGNQPASLRGHGSQRNFGGKDFHNRRGGSFNSAGPNYQNNFRNRNQHSNRAARQDAAASGSKEGTTSTNAGSTGKENRRTLTDFKIVGLKIPEISWAWGKHPDIKPDIKEQCLSIDIKEEPCQDQITGDIETPREDTKPSTEAPISSHAVDAESPTDEKAMATSQSQTVSGLPSASVDSNQSSPPPSRMRIYFHTPVTPDDARPIPHTSSYYGDSSTSDIRKGKRKKLEDDDGDIEQGRAAPPPPPQIGTNGFGNSNSADATPSTDNDRSSVPASIAPSLPETLSEDWLMAAIVEGEEEAEAEGVLRPPHDEEENVNEDREQMDVHDELVHVKENHDQDEDDDTVGKAHGEHIL